MKNIILSLLISALAFSVMAQEKQLQFGLKSGLNMSILSASINSESSFKLGFMWAHFLKTPAGFRPEIHLLSGVSKCRIARGWTPMLLLVADQQIDKTSLPSGVSKCRIARGWTPR